MAQTATEAQSAQFRAVETWDDQAILSAIADGQAGAIAACRAAAPAIARAAALLAQTWRAGGRVAYAGAGSSGLVAMLDAVELPGTYGLDPHRLPVFLAGGAPRLEGLDQGSEDELDQAIAAAGQLGPADMLIAVSASGATPFTLALARAARARGVKIVGIACNQPSPLLALSDIAIALATGAEIVAGSTRMNAGTAQKCALNMLSTLAAMRLNRVHDGLMVDMRADNAKLRDRAAGIVARIAGVEPARARAALDAAGGEAKLAILTLRGLSPADAARRLTQADGNLRAVLDTLP